MHLFLAYARAKVRRSLQKALFSPLPLKSKYEDELLTEVWSSKEPHNLAKFAFKVSKNSTKAAAILKTTQQPGSIIVTSFRPFTLQPAWAQATARCDSPILVSKVANSYFCFLSLQFQRSSSTNKLPSKVTSHVPYRRLRYSDNLGPRVFSLFSRWQLTEGTTVTLWEDNRIFSLVTQHAIERQENPTSYFIFLFVAWRPVFGRVLVLSPAVTQKRSVAWQRESQSYGCASNLR